MANKTRSRLAALGVAALATLIPTAGFASAAEASAPSTTSEISFVVPPDPYHQSIEVYGWSITNIGSLEPSDFLFGISCNDGTTIPVTGTASTVPNQITFFGRIPTNEAGQTCTLSVTVDQLLRPIQFTNEGPFAAHTPNVHLSGTMVTVIPPGRGKQY